MHAPFPIDGDKYCPEHGLPLVEPRLASNAFAGQLTGHVLDCRYLLGGLAGRGGMGSVYEADNLRLSRRVAVKVLHPELSRDHKMRMRLFREVQATSRIHPPQRGRHS